MRISNRVYKIASKYQDSTYINKVSKLVVIDDLNIMGVTLRPWLDEKTSKVIAKAVSDEIIKNGVTI